jgi:hypothetical protein
MQTKVGIAFTVPIAVFFTACGGGGGSNEGPGALPAAAQCTLLATNFKMDQGINLPGCLTGGCSTGNAMRQLVLDSSNVYWFEFDSTKGATGGSINSIVKTGGSVTTVVSGLQGVNSIAVDDSNVYWTEYDIVQGNGAIKTVPKTGGPVTVLATGTPFGFNGDVFAPGAIALDSTFVYWSDINPTLRRVLKTGGGAAELATFGGARMVVDAGFSYIYGVTGASTGAVGPTTVARYPLSGGSVEVLAMGTGMSVDGDIWVDNKYLYGQSYGNAPDGDVFEVPIGGGAPIFVVKGLNTPHSIAIDNTYIYYAAPGVTPGPGGVMRVPKTGGAPTAYTNCVPVAGGTSTQPPLAGVGLVAVDSTNVYVMGGPSGTSGPDAPGALAVFPK